MIPFNRKGNRLIPKIADCFHLSSFVSDSVFLTEEGMLGSVFSVKGLDVSVLDEGQASHAHSSWHRAVQVLHSGCAIQVLSHRYRLELPYGKSDSQKEGAAFRAAYDKQLLKSGLYASDQYIFLWSQKETSLRAMRWWKKRKEQGLVSSLSGRLHEFERIKEQFVCQMKDYRCDALSLSAEASELLKVLGLVVNGGCERVSGGGGGSLKSLSGSLSSLLGKQQIAIRNHIQFYNDERKESCAAVLSLAHYPPTTGQGSCDVINQMGGTLIKIDTFLPMRESDAVSRLSRTVSKYKMSDDKAKDYVIAMQAAVTAVSQQELAFGLHQQSVMVLAKNTEDLDAAVDWLKASYADKGSTVIEESLGMALSFWGMCPGGFRYLSRLVPITSHNFVDFCPLYAEPQGGYGYSGVVHEKEPLARMKTRSKTAYWFNCHLPGSPTHLPLGHTLVVGGSGSGKTVFLSWLATQLLVYEGRLYYFDRDHSAESYFRHLGALCLTIDSKAELAMNPFALPDSHESRLFLLRWMEVLCGHCGLSEHDKRSLKESIDYAYEVLPPDKRYLSEVIQILPVDFTGWDALGRWLSANVNRSKGEYAHFFDHPDDHLSLKRLMYFDLSFVLDAKDPVLLRSVMMYLFHRIEQHFGEGLSSIVLDEAWAYLSDPFWCDQLKQWLPTLRKRHAHIVLATQSARTVTESKAASALLDNLATAVYFRQPMAREEEYQRGLRLSKKEYQWVKELLAPREVLVKQGDESVIVSMDISGMPDFLDLLQGGGNGSV